MLVLSRKEGERILIGSQISIVVTEVRGKKVRIGIEAPPDMPVHRQEVRRRMQRESQSSRFANATLTPAVTGHGQLISAE